MASRRQEDGLTAELMKYRRTRLYRWQYLEYMTVDTWVDYDEETMKAWDDYEKLRLFKTKILETDLESFECFATDELRGGYEEQEPSIDWIEASFPWVETWPVDAKYWTKNITNGMHHPVRKLPLDRRSV